MTFLYGDSSPATVQINFLEFLRDALGVLVEIAQVSDAIEEAGRESVGLERASADDVAGLDALEALIKRAVSDGLTAPPDSPAGRCAQAILARASDLIRAERDAVQADLARAADKSEQHVTKSRQRCATALETLLARHDLPETALTHQFDGQPQGAFTARLHGRTPYGVASEIELEVPAGHLFAGPLRVDRIAERIEVSAPEMSGWIQKSLKTKPHRLDRYHVVSVVITAADMRMKLRAAADGTGDGFDLHQTTSPAQVSIVRIGEQGATVGDPSVADEAEVLALRPMLDRVRESALELGTHRKRLLDARLDGEPVATLERPVELLDCLVAAIAPTVREISRHSLAPDELVLKRMLAGGKREEFFVSKAELRTVLDGAPIVTRSRFLPLGLELTPPGAVSESMRPPAEIPVPLASVAPVPLTPAAPVPLTQVVPAALAPSAPPPATDVVRPRIVDPNASRLEVTSDADDDDNDITVEISGSIDIPLEAVTRAATPDPEPEPPARPSTSPLPLVPPRPRVPRLPPSIAPTKARK